MALRRRSAHRRARGLAAGRGTWTIGALALASSGALAGYELAHVWRRGSAPLPAETDDVIAAAEVAARETVEVAVEGYQSGTTRENALLNLLGSFVLTFALARVTTHTIRSRGRLGPLRPLVVGRRHIHHFVPGIAIAFAAGGVSIVSRDARLDRWLALPFGTGLGLTLDESALLLQLDDVYWSEDGIVSVQITLATVAFLAALALALRVLARGEERVLAPGGPSGPVPAESSGAA